MQLFDSHAHLSAEEMMPDIDAIMQRAQGMKILNICTNAETLKNGLDLAKRFSNVYNAGATTPHDVETEGEKLFPLFAKAAFEKQLVAIGETGLDYHYKELDRKTQQQFLIRYLHLGLECKLPVIFHCREAFADLFSITDAEYPKGKAAVLHCFTGTLSEAKEVWDRGWYLSLSGIVTFKNSHLLRQVAKEAPLDQLLVETDSPYLAPQSKRGARNEPCYVSETIACIAEVKGLPQEKVAQATFQNGHKLFCAP